MSESFWVSLSSLFTNMTQLRLTYALWKKLLGVKQFLIFIHLFEQLCLIITGLCLNACLWFISLVGSNSTHLRNIFVLPTVCLFFKIMQTNSSEIYELIFFLVTSKINSRAQFPDPLKSRTFLSETWYRMYAFIPKRKIPLWLYFFLISTWDELLNNGTKKIFFLNEIVDTKWLRCFCKMFWTITQRLYIFTDMRNKHFQNLLIDLIHWYDICFK